MTKQNTPPPKTLVIHPADESTWFLDITYKDLPNTTVVTGGVSKQEVLDLIRSHDRVMMMGHGSTGGLFSVGQFTGEYGFIIDAEAVPLLRQKKDCVFIWCFASDFVKKHGLSGFSSGMFISEVGEAMFCKVKANQKLVDESNFLFVEEVGRYAHEDAVTMHSKVTQGPYKAMASANPVAKYNYARLAHFDGQQQTDSSFATFGRGASRVP